MLVSPNYRGGGAQGDDVCYRLSREASFISQWRSWERCLQLTFTLFGRRNQDVPSSNRIWPKGYRIVERDARRG